jgi:hypothetical protein
VARGFVTLAAVPVDKLHDHALCPLKPDRL